jgi:hypothetical protein
MSKLKEKLQSSREAIVESVSPRRNASLPRARTSLSRAVVKANSTRQ